MRRWATFLALAGAGFAAAAFPPLPAPSRGGPAAPQTLVPPGVELSTPAPTLDAGDAAREAQQLNGGGRVLAVESTRDGWRVKLLKDGNVRIVYVPH
jgi:hypothetical protein